MSDEQTNAPQSETASWFADNQANWDSRAHAHMFGNYGGKDELIADKTAISSVLAVDIDRFGDLTGKSVCHLQCHVGTDTIGFARRGASRVVGVDLSAESINYARDFAAQADADVEFIQSNVYDAREAVDGEFDLVYTSAGVLCWLPQVRGWAEVVAKLLAPGGTFFIRDDHPMFMAIGEDVSHGLRIEQPYFEMPDPLTWEDEDSYVTTPGAPKLTSPRNHQWNHSLGEIVTALIDAGLTITALEETPYSAWRPWPELMVEDSRGFILRDNPERLPLQFAITATKP